MNNNIKEQSPEDQNAEVVFLACCMMNEGGDYASIDEGMAGGITEKSFNSFHNKLVWLSMTALRKEGKSIDEAAIFSFMQNTAVSTLPGMGGNPHKQKKISAIVMFSDLCEIANHVSGHPVVGFIHSLRDKELLRAAIVAGKKIVEVSASGRVNGEEAKSIAEKELLDLTSTGGIKDTSKRVSEGYGERIEALLSGEAASDTYRTGFPSIDAKLMPFPRKTNIVIGARPSTGKTTIGFQIAANMCIEHGLRGVMFSLESPWSQIVDRAISLRTKIPLSRIKQGMISSAQKEQILKTKNDIDKLGLLIDDGRGRTVFDIRSLARRYKRTHGLDFVLIDHFSKIRPQRADRAAVEEISAELDDMKHELDCIVLTLAQFSRASEREKRRPMMSDLRECGTLEQDADIIMLLARHETDGAIDNDKRDLFCPKVRDGEANWDVTLGFNGPIYRFVDSHKAAQVYSSREEITITQKEINDELNPF